MGTGIPPPVKRLLRGEPIDNFYVILRANSVIFKEVVAILSRHGGTALKELEDYVRHALQCTENVIQLNYGFPRSNISKPPIKFTAENPGRGKRQMRKEYMNYLGQEGL